jgi:nucleoside phosphorylase/CheY-like chemotaxis protein
MLTVLIIDDEPAKAARIEQTIASVPEMAVSNIQTASDLVSARKFMSSTLYDLLILDVRIPNRHGEDPSDEAGCDFIKELSTSQSLMTPPHVIGITAYDDAFVEADPAFRDELWSLIKYETSNTNWQRQLIGKVQYLIKSKQEIVAPVRAPYAYDIGIITAIPDLELSAILALPACWEERRYGNDPTLYHLGTFADGEKKLSVVAAAASEMGMAAAAVLSMKVIERFRPRYLLMTGVLAGAPDDSGSLGDIVVADQSWNYESGKRIVTDRGPIFLPNPTSISLDVTIGEIFRNLQRTQEYVSEIEKEWLGPKPSTRLKMIIGPVASGSAVIANPAIIADVKSHQRKLVGIEMETYGMFFAARHATVQNPCAISIKSVSDFADSDKKDDFRTYAAFTSARYAHRFAIGCLQPLNRS